jgi:hypothetical protein
MQARKDRAMQRRIQSRERVLPPYPPTLHYPYKPNLKPGDKVATVTDTEILRTAKVYIQEKVDGASCGMSLLDDHPSIRGKKHLFRKGFNKETPSVKQFADVWNWFKKHQHLFEKLNDELGLASVYGDWMVAQHGIEYDRLPSYFLTYDIYDPQQGKFLDTRLAQTILTRIGFAVTPIVYEGKFPTEEHLDLLLNGDTIFSTKAKREGLYIKVSDGQWITHRFKMVRPGFVPGALFLKDDFLRNTLI